MLKTSRFGDVTRFDLARTLGGRGWYWTTAYLVDDVLIDTGCAFTAPELVAALDGVTLRLIVVTHSHEDHIGGCAALLRKHTGAALTAHPEAIPVLADPVRHQPLHPYRRLLWGWPEPVAASLIEDDQEISTSRRRLRVLFTPGHSPDHLCLYAPGDRWLFTGDLFVGGRDRGLRSDCNVWQIVGSLRRLAQLGATTLFPGSARVRQDPSRSLRKKISYLEQLGEQARALARQGRSERAIARRLLGGPMFIELFTLGHFSRAHLVRSLLSSRGEATTEESLPRAADSTGG